MLFLGHPPRCQLLHVAAFDPPVQSSLANMDFERSPLIELRDPKKNPTSETAGSRSIKRQSNQEFLRGGYWTQLKMSYLTSGMFNVCTCFPLFSCPRARNVGELADLCADALREPLQSSRSQPARPWTNPSRSSLTEHRDGAQWERWTPRALPKALHLLDGRRK